MLNASVRWPVGRSKDGSRGRRYPGLRPLGGGISQRVGPLEARAWGWSCWRRGGPSWSGFWLKRAWFWQLSSSLEQDFDRLRRADTPRLRWRDDWHPRRRAAAHDRSGSSGVSGAAQCRTHLEDFASTTPICEPRGREAARLSPTCPSRSEGDRRVAVGTSSTDQNLRSRPIKISCQGSWTSVRVVAQSMTSRPAARPAVSPVMVHPKTVCWATSPSRQCTPGNTMRLYAPAPSIRSMPRGVTKSGSARWRSGNISVVDLSRGALGVSISRRWRPQARMRIRSVRPGRWR